MQPGGAGSHGVKARNEGRDFLKEGEDILRKTAKKFPSLQTALDIWGEISFNYESTDTADARLTKQTTALSFIVNRPAEEPGFRLDRQESNDRHINYTIHAYAVEKPKGERY